jgi:two-component sensor histidine kinase/putative methionine-R-sulfoxide reductase with GAF domain
MAPGQNDRTIEKLLRQQAALAKFGSFAFKETDLLKILTEAAMICAASLEVPFCKVCRYRPAANDLLIEAGCGWKAGVVGRVVSQADETSPQGRAFVTREPVILRDIRDANNLVLPDFYPEHGIVSTVDVVIAAVDGAPYGVLEIDSQTLHQYDEHDINFLTGFANVLAQAVATAQKNKEMQQLLYQQTLLGEELQHRVRNNLQMVSAMLHSYSRTGLDENARNEVSSISRRVMTLAQIYDSLLGVGLSRTIDLSLYLQELCTFLPGLQEDRSVKVALNCKAESMMLPLNHVTVLGMVVAELVTNSYRHAFPERGGTIDVTLTHAADGNGAVLTIRDDGVGFTAKGETARRGMGLVRKLLEQMDGVMEVSAPPGTLWTLNFPVAALAAVESIA